LQQRFIAQAPAVFVVCANLNRSSSRYGTRGSSLYAIQDAAAATQNILLTAVDMGLGTVWIGAFDENKASEILNLPSNVRPLAIIPIGMPSEEPAAPPKRNIDDFTHFEKFGQH
ncbi:MAG: nitroreductase family protein, partial [Candidatus Hodarchaeota archaeon]